MKKLFFTTLLAAAGLWSGIAWSQGKPKLTSIQFLQGPPVTEATYGDVTVELKFDKVMDTGIKPQINYGLNHTYGLNLPVRGGWENSSLWQGSFTVTNSVPSTGDGVYYFEISVAQDTNGTAMDTTYSENVNNTTLSICRTGELSVNTDTLQFGQVNLGRTRDMFVTLKNTSCADLKFTSFSIAPPFFIVNPIGNNSLPGGSSYTLRVRFAPNNRVQFNGSLVISSNARINPQQTIILKGSGKGPHMVLNPANAINFGKIKVDSSATRTLLVHNQPASNASLSDTLFVKSITTNDANSYSANPTQFRVAPGDTQAVQVRFTPKQTRAYNNYRLTLASNDSAQVNRQIVLNGNARDETPPPPVTGVTITWSGYPGFVFGDNLALCWAKAVDPSNIAQLRWYFSKKPVTISAVIDTQSARLRRVVLQPGATCANIPLKGQIGAGRWYCYLWFVDGQGNSGYRNATQTTLRYDNRAPAKPVLIRRFIEANRWFGAGTAFRIKVRNPKTSPWNWSDVAEVRWKFKNTPTGPADYSGHLIFTQPKTDTTEFTIPFNSPALCGQGNVYIWMADSTGNSVAANSLILPYRFDMCAPRITRTRPGRQAIAQLGKTFRDTLTITDDAGVDSVWVQYRFGGADAQEPPRRATRIRQTNQFVFDIPIAGITKRGIEYRVMAKDILNNQGAGPNDNTSCSSDKWYPVVTRLDTTGDFRIDADGRPVPLIAGSDSTSYQLFSVPYRLDKKRVQDVLEDDLGAYDAKFWRLFDYLPQNPEAARWREGRNVRQFEPGRAYFLITRKENIVADVGAGQTVKTVCPDSIRVFEGWNLVATPFNFPINIQSLSLVRASAIGTLRSFERGWNIIDIMEPWRGYAIYVTRDQGVNPNAPLYLVVQPRAAAGRAGKSALASSLEPQPGEWQVRIRAEAGMMHDRDNWAGIRYGANPAFDAYELAEPPVIGKYVEVAFPHPEWRQPATHFSTDFQPAGAGEYAWEFVVNTNQAQEWVHLDFDLQGDLPADRSVYLIDAAAGVAQDLRHDASYAFRSGKSGSRKTLKLVVGSRKFAEEQAGDIALVPDKFELLQNFPNPFNPETSIRFNLPEAATVRVVVYDQLGRVVRTLVNNDQRVAGYHTIVWDGRDDSGLAVASGIYVYKVAAGSYSAAKKMILLK